MGPDSDGQEVCVSHACAEGKVGCVRVHRKHGRLALVHGRGAQSGEARLGAAAGGGLKSGELVLAVDEVGRARAHGNTRATPERAWAQHTVAFQSDRSSQAGRRCRWCALT